MAPVEPALRALGGPDVELAWDATAHPMALVRDPESGEILTFARGGSVRFRTPGAEVEVVLSDGLRSSDPIRVRVR